VRKNSSMKRVGAAKKIVLPKNSSFMMKAALIDVKNSGKKLKIIKTDKRNAPETYFNQR